jgi:hypothetical protein
MVTKPTNADKCIELYYKRSVAPTYFGHYYDHS